MAVSYSIGLGQYRVGRGAEEWVVYGLGSCVGLILYDYEVGVSGIAHIVLPAAPDPLTSEPTRYADTGVLFLYNQLLRIGGRPGHISAMMVGGARVIVDSQFIDIGARNVAAVRLALATQGIRIVAERVGGTVGYTLRWFPHKMVAYVRRPGGPDEQLLPPEAVV